MAAPNLGLESLSTQLEGAVSSGSIGLPGEIYAALTRWFNTNLVPLLMTVVIFVTLLFTFYGAFLYFTAYGDENRATQAKKTLLYAIVGFAIAIMAFGIASYVQRSIISRSAATGLGAPTTSVGAPSGGVTGGRPPSF